MDGRKPPVTNAKRLFDIFEHMFPSMAQGVGHWGPEGRHAIHMETNARIPLIFTYEDVRNWRLETRSKHTS